MANYLAIVTDTAEGLKGLIAGGGTVRVEAAMLPAPEASASESPMWSATSWISARGQIWLAGP